jgi:hypothetical protein
MRRGLRRPRAAGRLVAASIAASSIAGCSTVLGIDANRTVASGAPDAAADAADPWGCLAAPDEELNPEEHVAVTLIVMAGVEPSTSAGAIDGGSDLDTVSGTWLSGVSVRACALRDLDCEGGAAAAATTDSTGAATFRLMENFNGFFEMSRSDLVPGTLYPGNFLTGQSVASFPAYAVSPAELQGLAAIITKDTVELDPEGSVGHALVTIYDCQDHQAPGVSLTYSASDAQTVPFYFQDGLPSGTATETDSYGLAGALNVPVGAVTVSGTLASGGRSVGMTTFLVRPGALTFAWIRARTH